MVKSAGLNIECIRTWARAFQFIGAVLLVILGITRFVMISILNPTIFILTIYYFLFAALLVIAEFQIKFIMKYFHFLYYGWGKSVLDFFLFTICFDTSNNPFFQVPVAIFFLVTAGMYLILAFVCKPKQKADEDDKDKNKDKEEKKEADKEADKEANRN